jgi:tRNA (guanine37-N1)-methyltransferase
MKQEKLGEKVREIFEEQGFKLEKEGNRFSAEKGEESFRLGVFSSEKFSRGEIEEAVEEGEKVFLDEPLNDLKEELGNEVSILKEKGEEKDLEVPSYERIGDIVVINELDGISREEAVEAIREYNPGIETILLKEEKVSGEFRVGGYKKLYGEETETVHREHGTRLKVDPTKMFFSEREGTERKRVFDSVEQGEEILVMFAGAAPFPVTIARNSEAERIVGVEKNPEAVELGNENIELNSVEDRVEMILGDVEEICPDLGEFDRVLMPSPTNALEFLDEAIDCVKAGGVLTVYSIQDKENLYDEVMERVKEAAGKIERSVEVLEKRIVADFSPAKRKVAVEFRVGDDQ